MGGIPLSLAPVGERETFLSWPSWWHPLQLQHRLQEWAGLNLFPLLFLSVDVRSGVPIV